MDLKIVLSIIPFKNRNKNFKIIIGEGLGYNKNLNLLFLYEIIYIRIFVYICHILYQFLETGTSDITFMGRDQELN